MGHLTFLLKKLNLNIYFRSHGIPDNHYLSAAHWPAESLKKKKKRGRGLFSFPWFPGLNISLGICSGRAAYATSHVNMYQQVNLLTTLEVGGITCTLERFNHLPKVTQWWSGRRPPPTNPSQPLLLFLSHVNVTHTYAPMDGSLLSFPDSRAHL